MKRILFCLALLGSFSLPAMAADVLTEVKWSRLPTMEEFNALYPAITEDDFVGEVRVECRIRSRKGDLACRKPHIDREYDYIAKFVQALVEGYYQVDMKQTDRAAIGKRVRVTIRFSD